MKTVAARIKSVRNIQKITKAMKMVAAAKLRGDQARLENGAPFARPACSLFENIPRSEKADKSITYLAITGDKGLCGGVNSSVAKTVRNGVLNNEASGVNTKVIVVGQKGQAALKRLFADRFDRTIEDLSKVPFNYMQAAAIAQRVAASDPDNLRIVYNKFKSLISFDTTEQHVITQSEMASIDKLELSKAIDKFTFEPTLTEMGKDLHEFYLSSVIFNAYLQGAASEQSSRMNAMENASKNSGEMLGKLEILYNKARQAKITTELCEIVSGASAV